MPASAFLSASCGLLVAAPLAGCSSSEGGNKVAAGGNGGAGAGATPFGVSPNPYAEGLPSTFPAYCTPY